ncbi:MAG: BolA/IbaG family iron-sulfur metabolism protein [Chlamydiota bacterium]|nr:BolA/IbaG family iron-sulfur metabolism protein [Chlamydiota bacterium]
MACMSLAETINQLLLEEFPNSQIDIRSPQPSECHFSINIHSPHFLGMNKLNQQRAVMKVLSPLINRGALHAVRVNTFSPASEDKEGASSPDNHNYPYITELLQKYPALLFIKGSSSSPRCGFSRRALDTLLPILTHAFLQTIDVLKPYTGGQDIRQDLKIFSKWPTFPQLYLQGKFIGGADLIEEHATSGTLKQLLHPIIR